MGWLLMNHCSFSSKRNPSSWAAESWMGISGAAKVKSTVYRKQSQTNWFIKYQRGDFEFWIWKTRELTWWRWTRKPVKRVTNLKSRLFDWILLIPLSILLSPWTSPSIPTRKTIGEKRNSPCLIATPNPNHGSLDRRNSIYGCRCEFRKLILKTKHINKIK